MISNPDVFKRLCCLADDRPLTRPLVVVILAEWSGNCHLFAPILSRLEQRFQGIIDVCRIDVDQRREVVSACQIADVPTTLFFANGELVDKINGMRSENEMSNKIESMLATQGVMNRDPHK